MARPSPRWTGRRWVLDLRIPWGLGRHRLDVAVGPPLGLAAAVHEAYELLTRLTAERGPLPQLSLPVDGRTVGAALQEYREARSYRSAAGRQFVLDVTNLIAAEIGSVPLTSLTPPAGSATLASWRDRMRGSRDRYGRPIGPKGMSNRLQVLGRFLKWCCQPAVGYLQVMPLLPSPFVVGEEDRPMYVPLLKWVDETTFRAVRDLLYADAGRLQFEGTWHRIGLPYPECTGPDDYVARRRLYLSLAYYTGMRSYDLDRADDRMVSLEFGVYYRRVHKTHRQETAEAMPAPLIRDLEYERARLGRPWRPGEAIAGGIWTAPEKPIAIAAARLGLSPFNRRDLRRSFVYCKALAGVEEYQLIRLLGHVDSKMIRRVYLQIPPRAVRDQAGAAWPDTRLPGTGPGAVVLPLRPAVAKEVPKAAPRRPVSARNLKKDDRLPG